MPSYSYICENCDHEFELMLRIANMEQPLGEPCPSCKTIGEMRRKIYPNQGISPDPMPTNHKNAFRETMQDIRKHHPLGNIPDY